MPIMVATVGIALSFSASAVAAIRGCFDGRIAFDSLRNGSRGIYVMNPFAGGSITPAPDPQPVQLTMGPDDEKPSWSPPFPNLSGVSHGCVDPNNPPTMVAFQRTVKGNTNVYAIDAAQPEAAGAPVQVTHGGADTAPAWAPFTPTGAPKSTYPPIAFERNVNGHRDIFVANFDGSDETNLTNSPGVDETNPDWSTGGGNAGAPESTLGLTFDSDQGGRHEVWVMTVGYNATNPPGHRYVNMGMRQVTTGQPVSSNPSWFTFSNPFGSPGGGYDRLAFAGPDQDGGPSQINVADYTTAGKSTGPFGDPNSIDFSALTDDASENSAPAWSPLGNFIAYQKTAADGRSDIYALDPTSNDESTDVNLTQHIGDNRNPDWEAVGLQTADVFPIRPLGRRHRKRFAQNVETSGPPPVTHTLTASLRGSGQGVVAGPEISCPPTCVHIYADATVVPLRATAAPGSTFAGWAGAGCSGTGLCTVSIGADVHVRATFNLVPPVLSGLAIYPRKLTLTGRLVKGHCVPAVPRNRPRPACARAIALRVSYMLTIPASLTFTINQEHTGRLINGRCRPVTPTNKTHHRCVRLSHVSGSLTKASSAGAGTFLFHGVIGGRRIKAGSYRLTATASANGSSGNAQTTAFQILP